MHWRLVWVTAGRTGSRTPARIAAFSLAFLLSQAGAYSQDPVFRANARLVQVPAFVTQSRSNSQFDNLTASDFVVKDNGKLRQVTSLAHGESLTPLRVMFLVESSRAQTKVVNSLREMLPKAVSSLRAGDHAGLASVYPGHQVLLEPTTDREALSEALKKLRENQQADLNAPDSPLESTRSFEDLSRALIDLSDRLKQRSAQKERLAIVVVTDDLALLQTKRVAEIVEKLIRNEILVAAFIDAKHSGVVIARTNLHVMRSITPMRLVIRDRCVSYFAEETGGPVVRVRNGDYLSAMRQLLERMSDIYVVGFTPPEEELDGSYHRLEIAIRRDSGMVRVRRKVTYRKGYWAEK